MPDWESKFNATATWSKDTFDFSPCGYDPSTKDLHGELRSHEITLKMGDGAEKSWSDSTIAEVGYLLSKVRAYVDTRKENTPRDLDHMKSVVAKLQDKYKPIYIAVYKLVATEPGFAGVIALFSELQDSTNSQDLCQNRNDLVTLHVDGATIILAFNAIIEGIALATQGVSTTTPLKHLFRAAEKCALKSSNDPTRNRADNVREMK